MLTVINSYGSFLQENPEYRFYLWKKRVAEAKSLSDLLSCNGLPDQKLDYDSLSEMITDSNARGIQIIFDGLDECQDLLKDESSIVTRLLKGELKKSPDRGHLSPRDCDPAVQAVAQSYSV